MSELAISPHLEAVAEPLPVNGYFDPLHFKSEQQRLFANAPLDYGHELMAPKHGDYCTLGWLGHGKMLRRDGEQIRQPSSASVDSSRTWQWRACGLPSA